MSLLIRVVALDGESVELAAPVTWQVSDVKAEVEELTGLLSREQRLISGLVELKDEEELGKAFEQESTVELSLVRRSPEQAYWLEEVRTDGRKLREAPPNIQADEEVVLAAVRNNCSAFRSASEELRADREVVLAAIQENGNVLRYASPLLQTDLSFIMAAVRRNACSFNCASDILRGDRELVLSAVKENADVLRFVSVGFRADRALVLAAVSRSGAALQHAAGRLRDSREVVGAAVEQDGTALRFASPELKADRDIVLAAVRKSGTALQYAADALRGDRDVARTAVRQDGKAVKYASAQLQTEYRLCNTILERREPTGEEPGAEEAADGAGAFRDRAAEKLGLVRLVAGQRITHLPPRPALGRAMNRQQLPLAPPHAEAEQDGPAAGSAPPGGAPAHAGISLHRPLDPAGLVNGLSAGVGGPGTKRPRILLRHHPMALGTQLPAQLARTGLAAAALRAPGGEPPAGAEARGGEQAEPEGRGASEPSGEAGGPDDELAGGGAAGEASGEAGGAGHDAGLRGCGEPAEAACALEEQDRAPQAVEASAAEQGAAGGGAGPSRPAQPPTARASGGRLYRLRAAALRICRLCA